MDEQKWNANIIKMQAHFDANPGLPQEAVFSTLAETGNQNPDMREQMWKSIVAACHGMPNSPISRGRQSDVDPEILAGLAKALAPFRAAAVNHHVDLTSNCGESILWGRGGVAYADAEVYGDAETATKKNALIRALRANENPKDTDRVLWDGTFDADGNVSGITLRPKEEDAE